MQTLCNESEESKESKIRYTPGSKLIPAKTPSTKVQLPPMESFNNIFPLSWSHYRLLTRLDEPFKREFYEAK